MSKKLPNKFKFRYFGTVGYDLLEAEKIEDGLYKVSAKYLNWQEKEENLLEQVATGRIVFEKGSGFVPDVKNEDTVEISRSARVKLGGVEYAATGEDVQALVDLYAKYQQLKDVEKALERFKVS